MPEQGYQTKGWDIQTGMDPEGGTPACGGGDGDTWTGDTKTINAQNKCTQTGEIKALRLRLEAKVRGYG